jgi:mitogen-activated protein kinase kinase kinase 13
MTPANLSRYVTMITGSVTVIHWAFCLWPCLSSVPSHQNDDGGDDIDGNCGHRLIFDLCFCESQNQQSIVTSSSTPRHSFSGQTSSHHDVRRLWLYLMAQQRRPAHRVSSSLDNTAIARRKLQSRRVFHSRRRVFTIANSFPQTSSSHASVASSSPPASTRAVLVPLQPNLRRLPSRRLSEERVEAMRDAVPTGMKRKRLGSGTENATNGRSRSASRVKRRKPSQDTSDESDEASEMEVDTQSRWEVHTSGSSEEEEDLDSCTLDICSPLYVWVFKKYHFAADNFLIHEAPPRQLVRLRKDELVRLYSLAGLTEDAELLTKHEIVDCMIAARDDLASLPPSSPTNGADSGSSDCSSDGGHVAGGEETDFAARYRNGMSRRNTYNSVSKPAIRPSAADRCYSMSQIQQPSSRFPPRIMRTGSLQTAPRRYVQTGLLLNV